MPREPSSSVRRPDFIEAAVAKKALEGQNAGEKTTTSKKYASKDDGYYRAFPQSLNMCEAYARADFWRADGRSVLCDRLGAVSDIEVDR